MADPSPPPINITITSTGALPTPPATIWANLLTYLQATDPGYTILPAALIEDILSTDVAAIYQIDSCAIDLINSLTPDSANAWLLYKLGQIYGVAPGGPTNTSVFVVFTGAVGFTIAPGFLVGDGTYQYAIQDGGVIGEGGISAPLFALATQGGSWPVIPNSVTTIITSVPSGYLTSVTNPESGISGQPAESIPEYRAQVLQAGLAAGQGMARYLKTLLGNVAGVQTRLVSVRQVDLGWEIIVGGGDPYQVGYAILEALFDISTLTGSVINITGITNANPGVVTSGIEHGLVTGQTNVHIAGVVGMTGVNGGPYTVTVIDAYHFSFGIDTTGSGSYVSGGIVTPNNRNITVDLIDYPDTYAITFVVPIAQVVDIQLTWNTDSPNFVSAVAVAALGAPAIAAYINSIPVGQPINLFQAGDAFTAALTGILPSQYLSRMVWTVTIDGIDTSPESGTQLVYGDAEGYFTCVAANVTITQG